MREGWELKRLDEVMLIERGGSPRPIDKYITESSDGYNWIKISDATSSNKYIYHTKEKISPDGLKNTRVVYEGDFILSNSMSFGRPYIMKTTGCIHDGWLVLRDRNLINIDKDFLYYLLSSPVVFKQFDTLAAGSTVRNLNIGLVSSVKIPTPPLKKQQRIVAILDEAFAAIDKAKANLERNLRNAKELFQSDLNAVFSRKGEEWVEKTLGDIAKIKGGKRIPKGYKLDSQVTEFPYIRVTNFNDYGGIDRDDIQYINELVYKEIKNYTISSKDVYVSIAGTIGKTGIIPKELEGANITENACKLVLNENIDTKFIYYFTRTSSFIEQAGVNTRTTAMPKLALSRLATIKLSIPLDINAQKKLVEQFEILFYKTQNLESIYQKKLNDLEELKKSILQKAFSGELQTTKQTETAVMA